MWKCPRCQSVCNSPFCPKCGHEKVENIPAPGVVSQEQVLMLNKLSKSVKRLKAFCVILTVVIVIMAALFAFAYYSVWENIVDLWDNVELLWDYPWDYWY